MPRLIDLAESTPTPSRDRFVGRERERREFRNSVRYVLEKEVPPGGSPLYPHIFLPHGEGGMGKSALLCQFVRIAHEEGCQSRERNNPDMSLDWLAKVIAGAEKYRAMARTDPDFDPIRADPRFVALVGDASAESAWTHSLNALS